MKKIFAALAVLSLSEAAIARCICAVSEDG